MKELNVTPEKMAKVRNQLGLSQRDVADDIREGTAGAINLDNTKLSRYERGLIKLSDKAERKLVEYYDRKAIEKGLIDEEEEEEIEDDGLTSEVPEVSQQEGKMPQTKVVKMPNRKKSVVDDGFGRDSIGFDKRIDPDVRECLLMALNQVNSRIEEALDYKARRGIFFYSTKDSEKAFQLIFDMAAAYNVIRTLQGTPLFPAFKEGEPSFDKESLLNVIKVEYPHYINWLFLEGEDAEETPEEQKQGSL